MMSSTLSMSRERLLVGLIVAVAAAYVAWSVMPQSWRLRVVTRLAVFPPTAAAAGRILQRWRTAQGCTGCAPDRRAADPAAEGRKAAGRATGAALGVASVLAALSFSAASGTAQAQAKVPAQSFTVVDDTGARVALAGPARRIVSLSPGATELLFSAGAGDRIVATITGADEPAAARRIERIGDANALVFPRLRELKPDVVVVWKDLVASGILESLAKMKLPVYTVTLRRFEDLPRSVRRLGVLAGTTAAAEKEAVGIERKVAALPPRAAAPKQRVYYMMLDSPLYTVGSRHLVDDAILRCGGRNIFDDIDFPAPIVEFEEIRKRNPDVIVMVAPPVTARGWRERWQPFKEVAAVRDARIFAFQDPRLDRMGPSAIGAVEGLCAPLARGRR
ncbi:MAG: helical backbone metal receptor [Gammaproteobacteria bacterium]